MFVSPIIFMNKTSIYVALFHLLEAWKIYREKFLADRAEEEENFFINHSFKTIKDICSFLHLGATFRYANLIIFFFVAQSHKKQHQKSKFVY